MRSSGAGLLAALLAGALAFPACREAGKALASGPGGATGATALVEALAARFGPTEHESAFETLRPKLARSALVPSRVFDDATSWSERGGNWRSVGFEGSSSAGTYRIGLRDVARTPRAPGEYRGHLRLTRTEDGRYEWAMREELAAGPIRPAELAAALTALVRGAEARDGASARAELRSALPHTTAALARLFRLETLDLAQDAHGATVVRLAVRLVPEALSPEAPRCAAFVERYFAPMRFKMTVGDLSGRAFWTLDAADKLWTLGLRVRAGSLVPLQGPPDRGVPDDLVATIDYSTKMGIFRVGVRRLVASVSLTRSPAEKGFLARFREAPQWQLPFLIKPFLQGSLRYPFEGPGSEAGWSAIEQPSGTLLVREYRARVRESWIVRWLGGLAGTAVVEFRRGAEAEAERFTRECFLALRDDMVRLQANEAPRPGRPPRPLR